MAAGLLTPECSIRLMRWQDDCRPKQAQEAAAEGWEKLRYLPLDRQGRTWLTLGAEYRVRAEALDQPTYGLTPIRGYFAVDQRILLDADVRHVSGLRAFVQLSAGASGGRSVKRPFDRSEPDLQQGFIDVPLGRPGFILRVGRQEFDSDGARFLALRDAANFRLAFDMAQTDLRTGDRRLSVFWGRPVLNRSGAFDDRHVPGEWLAGVIARTGVRFGRQKAAVAFYALQRRRAVAGYQDARGAERRDTYAVKVSADQARYSYSADVAVQEGKIGRSRILAPGVAAEGFWKTRLLDRGVRLGATMGWASGDGQPGDRRLGTFDVLYPNLGYFTDAPVFYPGNSWDVNPQAAWQLTRRWELGGGADLLSRISSHDAIYQAGRPLILGDGTGGSFLGALAFLKSTWTWNQHVSFMAQVVRAIPGTVSKQIRGEGFNYGLLQTTFRY